jgi:hypothetical protein
LNGQEWSALNEAVFVVGQPRLVVSELHYHPAAPSAAEIAGGFIDENDFEFIELYNSGNATFDLSGASFALGIDFVFPSNSRLGPGQFLLLVKNRAAFETRYGTGRTIAGEYGGRLSNSGERIHLLNARQETILDFTYGTTAPWPESADGSGPSLEAIDLNGTLNSPANWRASTSNGGSPGQRNPASPVTIEVLPPNGSELRLAFDGKAGYGYTVYASDMLSPPNWQIVRQELPLAADQRVELNIPKTAATRFFHISVP